jgi:ABC-2 type transport system permease protein
MTLLTAYVSDLYRYRSFLSQSVERDLKKRYKRTVLGYVWSMLNPLLMMAVLSIAFSKILGTTIENYPLFLFAGMIPYQFFSQTVSGNLGVIANSMNILNVVPAPKYLFPSSIAISDMVNLILALGPFILLTLLFGKAVPWTIVLLPLVLIPLYCAVLGVALLFSVANVFFEDTSHLAGVFIQSVYYLSPVLYAPEHLPEKILPFVQLNPMFHTIQLMRKVMLYGEVFTLQEYGVCSAVCMMYLVLGLWVFRRSEDKFVYFV